MLFDALFVFFEVCVLLLLVVTALWGIAKLAGYVAMVFEGEPLVAGVLGDVAVTRRHLRRVLHPRSNERSGAEGRARPMSPPRTSA